MTRRLLTLLPAALLSAGCAGTFAGTASARLEGPVAGDGGEPAALQAAPTAVWRSAPGPVSAGVRYAPTAVLETRREPLLRHRLAAEAGSARAAGMHPYGRAQLEYGTVRAGDQVTDEVVDAVPQPDVLRSWGVRLEGGVRGRVTRRTAARLAAGVDRSAGLGDGAAVLPALTRLHAAARAAHERSRATRLEAGLAVSHLGFERSAWLLETDGRATRELSRTVSAFAAAGAAAARLEGHAPALRPIASVGVTYTVPGGGPAAALGLGTRPDFDRIDGTLRQKLQAHAAVDAPLPGEARLALRVQGTGDLPGAEEPRRLVNADASIGVRARPDWRAELGLRAFAQSGTALHGATPSRARLYLGLTRTLD